MGGLFNNFWTSWVSISTDKRNFGSPRYVFEVQFGRPVAIERKCESSEGNFTRTKAKIGVKIRRIRRFRELCYMIYIADQQPVEKNLPKEAKRMKMQIII